MKKCYDINFKNLTNFLSVISSAKIDRINTKYKSLFKTNYKPNIEFFSMLQTVIIDAFNVLNLESANDKTVKAMYDLIILVTMNQSMQYNPTRGLINYEKYHEDKQFPRSVRIMKSRLAVFKATLNSDKK